MQIVAVATADLKKVDNCELMKAPRDGTTRAAITATPPELVIIVQNKAFSARDNSPMTAALWK
jgi:hypothetical protein